MSSAPRVVAVILAGGAGSRMGPLTEHRAKPALRLAGTFRLIDVALSNLVASGISDVFLVEQYLPSSFDDHLAAGRPWDLDRTRGGLVRLGPFQGARGEGFATGNSDSLWRQRDRIAAAEPDLVIVLSADHLYTLDLRDVIARHQAEKADLTMVTSDRADDSSAHGVVESDADGLVTGFWYKPDEPATDVVATEIFCCSAGVLLETLDRLHDELGELGDWGEDLVPHLVENNRVIVHPLEGYWTDLGTPSSYWQAHMDLLAGRGVTLDDPDWPILTAQPQLMPARIEDGAQMTGSVASCGARVAGTVRSSVLGPGVRIEPGAEVHECVILDDVVVPAGAHLTRCIVDAGARVPAERIGAPDAVTVIDRDGATHRPEED
ncbi:glucose-1-phosphate adenylyltransferase family protein [Brachybacterium huguangmaarense]